ncbi:MAG: glycosyltransferase [Candidatus Diapherotrites archaeon]|nr:glycosyltransferase [Candidatus Diapherotrites archaeon]
MPEPKPKPQGLFVFVPAYDEGQTFGKVLSDLVELKNEGLVNGILAVDDGSKDRTGEIADSFKARGVEVIHFKKNAGKAMAFYRAVRWAHERNAEFFGMFDADLKGISREQIEEMMRGFGRSSFAMKEWNRKNPERRIRTEMVLGQAHSEGLLDISGAPLLSGQRIIRMSALKPLLIGNKNWLNQIAGINKTKNLGKVHFEYKRRGYGLEEALNSLVGQVLSHGRLNQDPNTKLWLPLSVQITNAYFLAGKGITARGADRLRQNRITPEIMAVGDLQDKRDTEAGYRKSLRIEARAMRKPSPVKPK